MKPVRSLQILLVAALVAPLGIMAEDLPTGFTNMRGVVNTRHNLSQSTEATNNGTSMNAYRNRYGEVCVYCHTPHTANANVKMPLWNRHIPTTTYATYDLINSSSLTQAVFQPGAASLTCLSCHDGQQATDAILNMPGPGQYFSPPEPGRFVPTRSGQSRSEQHQTLAECMSCHAPGTAAADAATDFTLFLIGTDLRNDHPVGVLYPTLTGAGTDWNTPGGSKTAGNLITKYFDKDNDSRLSKEDVRLYDTGNGASVECASCHDPHGVPSGGGGDSQIYPTFLRNTNAAGALCRTCHNK